MNNTNQNYLPLFKLLPNTITLLALCFALTALQLSLNGQFEKAVMFVVIGAFLDVLDGRFARLFNVQSPLGANLDSLCDFINFGFVPSFIIYLWALKDVKLFGWGAVLIATVCTCIRLARFNIEDEERAKDPIKSHFFSGIPAPAGGVLILSPLILSFSIFDSNIYIDPKILVVYVILIALLMASTVPTFSTKHIKIKHNMVKPIMIIISVILVSIFLYEWLIIVIMSALYIISIPYSIIKYYFMSKKNKINNQISE